MLHLQSTTKVKTTGDNKYVGFSRAYITLTYDNYYSQTATGSTGVSASRSNSGSAVSGYYKSGTTTTYTATLSDGYGFKGWYTNSSGTGTPVSTDLSYSETCNSDRTLYAIAYTVSASGSTGVTASVSRGSDGRTFTFIASLSNNYAFDGWYNGSTKVSGDLSYSVTLSDNTALTAKAFSVSYSGDTGISVSASRSSDGKSYTFTGTFANGTSTSVYTLNKWTVNGSASSESSTTLTVSITSNTTVTASSFTTTVAKETGVSSVSVSRASATSVTATATLSDNYAFDGWYNGNTRESQSLSYTKTISGNTTLTAKAFSVSYSGDTGISVSATRSSDGRSYTFTGSFASGTSTTVYTLNKWTVNGSDSSESSTTLTVSITSNTTVTASSFTTTVAKETGVSSVSVTRASATSVTATATLSDNYAFDGWYNGNTRESQSLSYTKTISGDTTLTAKAFSVSYSGDSGISVSATRSSDGRSYTFTGTLTAVTSTTAYTFNKWTVNGTDQSETSLTLTKTIDSNTTVSASSFATVVAKDSGFSAASISRTSNTSVTVTATLKDNYALDGWYNGNTRENRTLSYTKTISASATLTAKSFSVSYDGDSGISVTATRSSDGRSYTFTGTLVTESTYASVFKEWTFNGSTISGATTLTYTRTIEANSTIAASSYTITVAKGTGASSVSISRNSITSLTISCSMSTGYDFDGWYVSGTKKSSTAQTTLSSITASETYTANGVLHVYSLSAVGDGHSTGTITTDNYYYGTVATFTATVTDNKYMFIGWYNDANFTSLYSSNAITTYTITGDKTLYIKTRQKNRVFLKVNGTWQEIPVVRRKVNGTWVVIDPDDYPNTFHTDVKYIKGN